MRATTEHREGAGEYILPAPLYFVKRGIVVSRELMRRAIIDMILWTDNEEKIKSAYLFLSSLLKRAEDGSYE